jgi:hypothetical protein
MSTINDVGRTCSKCKEFKSWPEFYLSRTSKTGHTPSCKQCIYNPNPQKTGNDDYIRELEWRKSRRNAGICISCGKIKAEEGAARCLKCSSRRRKRAEEKAVSSGQTCISCGIRTWGKLYCWNCWIEFLAENRTTLEPAAKEPKEKLPKDIQRQRLLDVYGRKCACCGETTERFLTVDHINNDGAQDRLKSSGQQRGGNNYRKLLKDKRDDIQILCFNCNCGRALNGGICPHKQEEDGQIRLPFEISQNPLN